MIGAAVTIFNIVIQLLLVVSFAWAILSWLIAFDVVNLRNRFIASVWNLLNGVMSPMLAWIPRQVRYLGGVDISPIVLWLILIFLRTVVNNVYLTGSLL